MCEPQSHEMNVSCVSSIHVLKFLARTTSAVQQLKEYVPVTSDLVCRKLIAASRVASHVIKKAVAGLFWNPGHGKCKERLDKSFEDRIHEKDLHILYNYSLIRFFLGLFVYVHVPLQVHRIDELLGTQIARNYRFPSMQQSVCLQIISTCEGWTTIITYKILLISVSCHMPLEVCTFHKSSVTLCALVSLVPFRIKWDNQTH